MFEKMIILMGVDGSGKTAHARALQSELRNSGVRCKYIWFGSAYFFSLIFMMICRVLGFVKLYKLPNGHMYSAHLYSKKPLSLLWPLVQFFDVIVLVLVKVKRSAIFNDLIIADRFVYDLMIDVMNDVGNPFFFETFVGKLIRKLIPSDALFFVLDVDEQTALGRKTDIPNWDYLKIRRKQYLSLAGFDVPVIDSSGSFEVTHRLLTRALKIQRGRLALTCIKKSLQQRLLARAHWAKWKKGPVPKFRRMIKRAVQSTYSSVKDKKTPEIEKSLTSGGDGQYNPEVDVNEYVNLLWKRGLTVHTVVLLGSRAKKRGKPTSDIDLLVVASGLPNTFFKFLLKTRRARVLADSRLSVSIESYGLTKLEFLQGLRRLELAPLDAMCCGKVLIDDGFWATAESEYKRIQDEYCLDSDRLRLLLSLI